MESPGHLKKLRLAPYWREALNFKAEWNFLPESPQGHQGYSLSFISHPTWHSTTARLVPNQPLSTLCSCQLTGFCPCQASHTLTACTYLHALSISCTLTHTFSVLPNHSFPVSFSGLPSRCPQPPCSPVTCPLLTLCCALDSLLCVLLVHHRPPCTMKCLVDAFFLSPDVLYVPVYQMHIAQKLVLQKILIEWSDFLNLKALPRNIAQSLIRVVSCFKIWFANEGGVLLYISVF